MSATDIFERQDLGPFDGDKSRERIEHSYLLDQLTEHPGWQVLLQIVGDELAAWERRILSGTLDPDQYRHRSGYVRGIRTVLETPSEFARLVAASAPSRPEQEE